MTHRQIKLETVQEAPCRVVLEGNRRCPDGVRITRQWDGGFCKSTLVNDSPEPVRVSQIVLAEISHELRGETIFYGEGFTMLSQTSGTLGKPSDVSGLTDRGHYRIPQPPDATTVYGMLTLRPPEGETMLMAFTSCRRFVGRFHLRAGQIQVVLDAEALTLAPRESWELEEFMFDAGADREALLASLAERISRHHRPLRFDPIPTGWCSWYCFGPSVTASQVLDNLDVIARRIPELKFIQIDDGYQAAMGDWLDTGRAFGGGITGVLEQIRKRGFAAAIWVAPFIAEQGSRIFAGHPGWFMKDDRGQALRSDRVTFGGWRNGPWYALDGTHPEAQEHLTNVFRTMHEQWGCGYFKLDANFWGAMHGGRLHDPKATRVEAYRRGMQAVLRGAGDGFVLGCNHPLWPSLGLVHGSRSSNDISRNWRTISNTAIENLGRNWQNGRLWWNDPDCIVLTGDLSEQEFLFHATVIYATGGMVLSGDDLTKISAERLAILRKLVPPTGLPAQFRDDSFRVGLVRLKGRTMVCLFNWEDCPQTLSVALDGPCRVRDYWTGEDLGRHEGLFEVRQLPPHSARLLACEH
jgi:alpha-galactosidase